MKIGSNYYIFDGSIFLIDRKRIMFIISAVCTVAFCARFVDYALGDITDVSFVNYCKSDRLWFLLVVAVNILHFVTYHISLNSKLKFIVTKSGLIIPHGSEVFLLPWNYVVISNEISIDFQMQTHFFIKDIKAGNTEGIFRDNQDDVFSNKVYTLRNNSNWFKSVDGHKRKAQKQYQKILSWQQNKTYKSDISTKLSRTYLFFKLAGIIFGNTLISYTAIGLLFILLT